jgi:hypothetical protein
MKKNRLLILAVAILALSFYGCSNSDDSSKTTEEQFTLGETVTRDFAGKIVDSNNNPISGAIVKIGGNIVETNAQGKFTLENVSVPSNFAYFTINKSGFINGSRAVITHDGVNNIEVMMLPAVVTATIPSGSLSNVTLANSTKITFDGAFMDEDGTAYSGNVKVIVNHLDAADPNVFKKMPGNLIGQRTDGSFSGMETYGMINVEMLGDNNQKLQIASGHQAAISLPIAQNQLDDAPATIPLWHFNEVTGLWEEQGQSQRVGNKYLANVSHFSWWNNDYAYVVATLNVLVQNYDGTPVVGVRVTINRQAGSTGDVLMDLGITGANGTLSAGVPKNEVLTFKAYTQDGTLIDEQILPASNASVRNVTVIIPIQNRVANPKG